MSWKVVAVDPPKGSEALVGHACYAPHLLKGLERTGGQPNVWLSRNYVDRWLGKRPPIVVALPLGNTIYHFCVDGPYKLAASTADAAAKNPTFQGWDVTGDLPNITVSPSIDMSLAGGWHGFIKNGIVEDDVRANVRFDERGRKI